MEREVPSAKIEAKNKEYLDKYMDILKYHPTEIIFHDFRTGETMTSRK